MTQGKNETLARAPTCMRPTVAMRSAVASAVLASTRPLLPLLAPCFVVLALLVTRSTSKIY
eukprot:COSAG06_NODE_1980_length_7926_cov_10.286061_6_plen_61_part_00